MRWAKYCAYQQDFSSGAILSIKYCPLYGGQSTVFRQNYDIHNTAHLEVGKVLFISEKHGYRYCLPYGGQSTVLRQDVT